MRPPSGTICCARRIPRWRVGRTASECLDKSFEAVPPFEIDPFRPVRIAVGDRRWADVGDLLSAPTLAGQALPDALAAEVENIRDGPDQGRF